VHTSQLRDSLQSNNGANSANPSGVANTVIHQSQKIADAQSGHYTTQQQR